MKTHLSDICEWVGNKYSNIEYPEHIDIYFKNEFNWELSMLDCVKNLLKSRLFIKLDTDGNLINSTEELKL